ncbi:alkaline phosphatase family protein [Cardiobacteriales bacterium ML27]|uniref:Alkaline phosphatase family protein n=2 Tax=Ostreibacterium oceani TaxID=2654998 RepID=A0A6N7EWN2_9GAMM|nr:alkaline phosphatase family protein [Ostreibacterium oceani]
MKTATNSHADPNTKTILIIIDGLANEIAEKAMGSIHSWIEAGIAKHQVIECALPSASRPLYETILTGKTPYESGITVNTVNRLSNERSLFHDVSDAGLTTAAAAYHWFSELYNQSPYDVWTHRIQNDKNKPIQHGIFYHQDHYPDMAVFQDAEYLRKTYDPDFLLIHPMNVDDTGHQYGVYSDEYLCQARQVDQVIGHIVPAWIAAGYQILITSDHGMNNDKGASHGGMAAIERLVPLYVIGERILDIVPCQGVKQTEIIAYLQKVMQITGG